MLNHLTGVFKSFQEHEVRYLIIGGIASILYGVPRATFDLDILIHPTHKNARKLLDALNDAGFSTASLTTPEDILENEITIFKDLVRINVQTSTPGINFEASWKRREIMKYHEQRFYLVSKKDLIASKKASGRAIDIEDVRLLELTDQ